MSKFRKNYTLSKREPFQQWLCRRSFQAAAWPIDSDRPGLTSWAESGHLGRPRWYRPYFLSGLKFTAQKGLAYIDFAYRLTKCSTQAQALPNARSRFWSRIAKKTGAKSSAKTNGTVDRWQIARKRCSNPNYGVQLNMTLHYCIHLAKSIHKIGIVQHNLLVMYVTFFKKQCTLVIWNRPEVVKPEFELLSP